MKKYTSALLTASIVFTLFQCTSPSKESSNSESAVAAEPEAPTAVENPAVCIWDQISVRETPGGKYLTAMSVGESITYMGIDSTTEKSTHAMVRLNDGKEGWAVKDYIVSNAKPAVVLSDISLYSRPDLLTKTEKKFTMMDIVASIETEGDWMKIKGRLGKWMSEGWVKSDNVSFEAIDIAGAKFAKQALALEDEEERVKAINEIIDNPDLSGSRFVSELESHLLEIIEAQTPKIEETEEEVSEADTTTVE